MRKLWYKFAFLICLYSVMGPAYAQVDNLSAIDGIEVHRLGVPDADTSSDRSFLEPSRTATQQVEDTFDWERLQTVWDNASAEEWDNADIRLRGLQHSFPGWVAPKDLRRLISRGLFERDVTLALERQDWDAVLSMVTAQCDADFEVWARSEALSQLGRADEALLMYQGLFLSCESSAQQQLLIERAAQYLDLSGLQTFRVSHKTHSDQLDWSFLNEAIASGKRNAAIQGGDWRLLAQLSTEDQDRGGLIQAAWELLQDDPAMSEETFAAALSLSQDIEAQYGRALAAYMLGDVRLAEALSIPELGAPYYDERRELIARVYLVKAQESIDAQHFSHARDLISEAKGLSVAVAEQSAALEASIFLEEAEIAYDAGNYHEALAHAEQALVYPQTVVAARSRIAWAQLNLGLVESAYEGFLSLYKDDPSQENAEGLVLAANKFGKLGEISHLVTDETQPLYVEISRTRARNAYYQKDYLIARRAALDAAPELDGVDNIYVYRSFTGRANDLAAGEGQTNGFVARTSVGFAVEQTHIEVGFVGLSLDAGTGSDINRSAKGTGIAPFAKFDREGSVAVSGLIGATPIGGPVDATVVGALSARFDLAGVELSTGVHRKSIEQTVTSLFGREDEVTGETWGRVVENAISVTANRAINEAWNVSGEAKIGQRTGNNVEDNGLILLGGSATKSFKVKNHDYLSAGPFYQYQSFDNNTNFHSAEQGGYFSPQSYHRVGAGVYGLTTDVRPWLLKYQAALALEVSQSDEALVRPLTNPDGAVFGASSGTNIAGNFEIEYGRKLSKKWTLTAGASATVSQAFNEARIGVSLKYVFGGKANVTTRDFWPDPFSRDVP